MEEKLPRILTEIYIKCRPTPGHFSLTASPYLKILCFYHVNGTITDPPLAGECQKWAIYIIFMKLDFAQNWQNATKNGPYRPPGAAETKIFGVMGLQPPIQSCPKKIFEFFDFHRHDWDPYSGTLC